jgi:hypothetical protein
MQELNHIIADHQLIVVPYEDVFPEDRIMDPGSREEVLRKAVERDLIRREVWGQTGQLRHGLQIQIRLNGSLERPDQLREAGQDRWTRELPLKGTQYQVLIFASGEDAVATITRNGKRLGSIEVMRSGLQVGVVASTDAVFQGYIDAVDGVYHAHEGPHIYSKIVIGLHPKVEVQGAGKQAGPGAWIAPVAKAIAWIAVQVGLIELFVVLTVKVVGNLRNLDPHIPREVQNR